MCSISPCIRVVPAPDGFFDVNNNPYTVVVTIPKLRDELLSFQRSSRCPADCMVCGSKKGQLPPFRFTFVDDDNASLTADQLVATRCGITASRHFPSSAGYRAREYSITAFGYSKQDFWNLCLAPLMKRVQLSSLPNLILDWSHVQVLELEGEFRMPRSSTSIDMPSSNDETGNTHHQDLFTQSEAELLTTILVSSTCQIFHLDICWRSMDNASLFWDAVARCPTLSILTLKECDLLTEIPSVIDLLPTPGTLLASSDKNHVDSSSSTLQEIKSGNLQELTIQGCILDENSLDSLCQLLRNTTKSLQHAIMLNNIWPLDAGCKVMSSFMSHTQLKSLDCAGLNADYTTIQAIGSLMTSCPTLQKLKLSECSQVIDVRPLADGLIGSTLHELDLSHNRLINMGTLAVALHENQNLHTLNLSITTIDADDDESDGNSENCKANPSTFLANLGNTRGLKVLVLDEAKLCSERIDELARSLRSNTSLESLHLNNIGGSVSLTSIINSLQDNKTLRTLQIGQNRLDDKDVNILIEALCLNRSLKSLTLSHCDLSDDHLKVWGERLWDIGLESLDLSFNSFGAKGVMALWHGLFSNYALQQISLFDSSWSLDGPVTFECQGYNEENELIQDLLLRNRDAALASRVD